MKNGLMPAKDYKKLAIASVIIASALSAHAQATLGPVAKPPYTVTVFAHAPEGLTNPDSITTAHGKIYVVTGMMTPHGALFVPANPEDDEHGDK